MRELVSGSGADRLLSANDLANSGLATVDGSGNIRPPSAFVATPPPPTTVTATAAIRNIIVTWDNPAYVGHAHAEVWGSSTSLQADSVLLGMSPGAIYVDDIGPSATRYYWVRFVNTNDTPGPYNALVGTPATTGSDVGYFLDTLTEAALDPDSDYSKFAVRADFFSVMPSPDFNQEATPTATAIGDLWYQPSTELVRTWTGSTWGSFSQTLPFIVNTTSQTVNGVTVPPGVYMDAAFIKNGTITNAKIGNLVVDGAKIADLAVGTGKITDLAVTSAKIDSLAVTSAKIDSLAVTSAKIDNLAVGTGKITDLAVTSAKIDSLAVTSAKIDNLAVTTGKIGNLAVQTLKIDDQAVSTTKYNVFNYASLQPSTLTVLASYSIVIPVAGDYIIFLSVGRTIGLSGFVPGSSTLIQTMDLVIDGTPLLFSDIQFDYAAISVTLNTRVYTFSAGTHTIDFRYRLALSGPGTLTGGITQARIYIFGAYK
jgi:hypothetical protein